MYVINTLHNHYATANSKQCHSAFPNRKNSLFKYALLYNTKLPQTTPGQYSISFFFSHAHTLCSALFMPDTLTFPPNSTGQALFMWRIVHDWPDKWHFCEKVKSYFHSYKMEYVWSESSSKDHLDFYPKSPFVMS